MGLDLGVVNFASVSFYTANRNKNYVISGRTLKSRITQLDNRIDRKKKELCIDVIKTIQSKKDKPASLYLPRFVEIREDKNTATSYEEIVG